MKTLIASIAILAIASCAPAPASWEGTPNPLDTPEINDLKTPEAEGRFGHLWI